MARLYPGDDDSGGSEEGVSADPVAGAGRPAGGAGEAWRHLGMYSFRIERIHPQTPEEKFWEGFRFPSQTHLETTKGEACGPLLWKPLRVGRRNGVYEGRWDGGRRAARRGRRALRGVEGVSSTTPASRCAAKRPRRRGRGAGEIGEKAINKGDGRHECRGERSERRDRRWSNAGFCPISSLFSTGHGVRRFDWRSARVLVGGGGSWGRTV